MRAARYLVSLLGTTALMLLVARPARADADSVLVRVGGDLSARAGDYIDVPVTVDLSGAPGRALGSYNATLSFNSAILQFRGASPGNFAAPQINTDSGRVRLAAVLPAGASGVVTIFVARFYVVADTAQSPITVAFDSMSAKPPENLVPLLRYVQQGVFCRSLGRWGDVNHDGQSNSFDALVALSYVVGDSINPAIANPLLADVDADGRITSRDALIILSYAVGLPVTGYRVLLTAPGGACGTGAAITLVVAPDSLELQAGQAAYVFVAAHDATGRAVATDTLTWMSSNPSVAAYDPSSGEVVARGAGVATLTARLGPGVTGTLKVSVIARRSTWYVDVQRASFAPTQVGTQALPMEFIGDALALAHDGDTVRVAGGTYEELIGASVAVVLLGDSANRPVLDPRGAPGWSSYQDAVDLEPGTGLIQLANLDIRAGQVYLDAHNFIVRNVRIEGLNTHGVGLYLYSENLTPSGAPRQGGPMRSSVPVNPGNVLIDGVIVSGDSLVTGIEVDQADSVEIRNSSVTRAAAGHTLSCGLGPTIASGIQVRQASVSYVHNNVVTNPDCQGIAVFDAQNGQLTSDVGRITISRNHVSGAPHTGIVAGSRLVALNHNAVQNIGVPGSRSYGATAGVHVIDVSGYNGYVAPDSVVSLGDTVLNSGGRGFAVDTAGSAVLDSLVVSGTGQDSSGSGTGVDLEAGGKFALSYSYISNTLYSDGVDFIGDRTVLRTHGNRIVGAGNVGLSSQYNCDCAPPARTGPALAGPARDGPYTGGPDTLISISDTILNSGGLGVFMSYGVYALVDSAVVDNGGNAGILLEYLGRAKVSNSVARRSNTGIYSYEVDSLSVLRDTVDANTQGVYVEGTVDSATIRGTVATSNTGAGFSLYYATARIDSSVAVNNHTGLYTEGGSTGARVRWTRFQFNNVGMWMGPSTGASSSVVNSNFIGDTTAGVFNEANGPTLAADANYWGDLNGPRCGTGVTGCSGLGTGDLITTFTTGGVTFAGWLASAAPTLAPPARVSQVAAASLRSPPADGSVLRPPPRPPEPLSTLGRARPAAPVAAAAPTMAAAAQRPPHQRAQAWHAPSKARTHGVQAVKKRS